MRTIPGQFFNLRCYMYTIYDIAKLSGVSKSTVSRVLSGHPYVSNEKKEKVMKIINELDYKPNVLARQFRKKQTNCIGILVPDLSHPYFSQLAGALSIKCYEEGLKPVVYQTFMNKQLEVEVLNKLQNKEMDGLILTSSSLPEETLADYTDHGIIAACNEAYSGSYFSVFCLDEKEAVYKATSYLLNKGLTSIGFCSDNIQTPSQQARLEGFIKAHAKRGLPYNENLIFDQISTIEDGMQLGSTILNKKRTVQGMIAGSDFVAAGLLKKASELNIEVPNECAVFGFDNHPISLVTSPALTTVCNNIDSMAEDLMNHLVKRMAGSCSIVKQTYMGSILYRKST